jgi:hypothetical protein
MTTTFTRHQSERRKPYGRLTFRAQNREAEYKKEIPDEKSGVFLARSSSGPGFAVSGGTESA